MQSGYKSSIVYLQDLATNQYLFIYIFVTTSTNFDQDPFVFSPQA